MKIVLFCYHPYAFGILKPLADAAQARNYHVKWFVREAIAAKFAWKDAVEWSSSITEICSFNPDAIFVPGNEVPDYIQGVKIQVFHGLAGEKKGHFRIRNYFDLYLTQGPYFTNRFKELVEEHKDFGVVETGWCKLDPLFILNNQSLESKEALLKEYQASHVLLYAPTFSPSLTSAEALYAQWELLLNKRNDLLVMVKFHDLMDLTWKEKYRKLFSRYQKTLFVEDPNILKYLVMADLLISDTSSVVYEFLLLNKPAITFNSSSTGILWDNFKDPELFEKIINETIASDPYAEHRQKIISAYHPYSDGKSSERMLDAAVDYINHYGVPKQRRLNLYRRLKIRKLFGRKP